MPVAILVALDRAVIPALTPSKMALAPLIATIAVPMLPIATPTAFSLPSCLVIADAPLPVSLSAGIRGDILSNAAPNALPTALSTSANVENADLAITPAISPNALTTGLTKFKTTFKACDTAEKIRATPLKSNFPFALSASSPVRPNPFARPFTRSTASEKAPPVITPKRPPIACSIGLIASMTRSKFFLKLSTF